ncbi:adhesion G protein-coupled receptor L3-like [Heptranchias perlo]|uniref:adhesion G protein-coupled receptor L3-like n=1 Tax=Heptranchias perlo TaxID=212740 RepID=UPI003559BF1F
MESSRFSFLLVMFLCKLGDQCKASTEAFNPECKESNGNCTGCETYCVNSLMEGGDYNASVSDHMCTPICRIRDSLENLLRPFPRARRNNRCEKITEFLTDTESTLMSSVEISSTRREERILMADFELEIRRLPEKKARRRHSEPLILSAMGNTMEVDSTAFTRMESDRTPLAVALITYKDMESILSDTVKETEDADRSNEQRVVLNSKVLTAVMGNRDRGNLTHPITLTFKHSEIKTDKSNTICVYWNMTACERFWSPEGCELVTYNTTHTVCRVYHLSSFAILMALKDLPDVFAVEVITQVGLSISLVCLLMAIVTFSTCHPLKETRRTIHTNLCLSLFVADLVFLFGISQTGNQTLCGIIAAVLHYFFLSVFAWMFLEGIQLYLMVEVVFSPRVPLDRYIYWIGYGFPAAIVAVSAAVNHNGYGTQSSCWLASKDYFVCSFFVPAILISAVNLCFLCKTLVKLRAEMSKISSDERGLEKKRVFTLTAIGQLFILGSTWILGGFYIQNATIPMMYIFTILNSFQGMFIFIMHCLLYKKVREAYADCLRRTACFRRSSKWKPATFSSAQTATTSQGRSVQDTELATCDTLQ